MADISTSPEPELTSPTSGLELANQLGVKHDEGVQVALFPESVTDLHLTDAWMPWGAKGEEKAYGVVGNWMSQTRLIDLMAPGDVKWWMVRNFAKNHGLDIVPVRWSGQITDIPAAYFAEGTVLGIRFSNHGPWFWPLEKPETQFEESDEQKEMRETVDAIKERHSIIYRGSRRNPL